MDKAEKAQALLGSNHAVMRAYNEQLVLTLLRQRGPTAKADIARLTGLSAQTVSVIMRKLENEGLLKRGEPMRGRVGQPSVPLRLAERGAFFFGLKVGRRNAELILTDFLGKVLDRKIITHIYPEPQVIVEFVRSAIADLSAGLAPNELPRIAGLGIATPFFLWQWEDTIGLSAERIAVWRDADIAQDIAAFCDFPVFLENDGSAACGAELVFAPSQTTPDFLYFYINYFIGGGVVIGGRLHTGPSGNAGALAPMPVTLRPGRTAPGGGQLLDCASLYVLENRYQAAGFDTTGMWETVDHWPQQPEITETWLQDAADALAYAIVSATAVFDFEEARIDGWIPDAMRDALVAATNQHIKRLDLTGIAPIRICAGSIGPDALALGAASLPLSQRFLVDINATSR